MSTRATIRVTGFGYGPGKHDEVWLYQHYDGYDIMKSVHAAISRRLRWDDPAYLTRILFDAISDGSHGEETGFGIAPHMMDNNCPVVHVDAERKTISLEPVRSDYRGGYRNIGTSKTFDEVCAATPEALAAWHMDYGDGVA